MAHEDDWSNVLASAVRLQKLLPDAVLVGGTASSLHAHHRISLDHDHVLADLRDRFDMVLDALETTDGWVTDRVNRPVLILGRLDGVETGIRQLIRRAPIEIEHIETPPGSVTVPTLADLARIKAWLVLRRNATRDYLDLAALTDQLGSAAVMALSAIDDYYHDQHGPGGVRVLTQLVKQLAEPRPYDLDAVRLTHYRQLAPRWQDWTEVTAHLRGLAARILRAESAGHGSR